jgi:hypothetical protein
MTWKNQQKKLGIKKMLTSTGSSFCSHETKEKSTGHKSKDINNTSCLV